MSTKNYRFQRRFAALCGAMLVLANAGLASSIINGLGLSANAADFRYTQPQLAGGGDLHVKFCEPAFDTRIELMASMLQLSATKTTHGRRPRNRSAFRLNPQFNWA